MYARRWWPDVVPDVLRMLFGIRRAATIVARWRQLGRRSLDGSVVIVPPMLSGRMAVAMGIVEERIVAARAAEAERLAFVHFGGGRVRGPDLHAADRVHYLVGHDR
jgi:hypothetical protein